MNLDKEVLMRNGSGDLLITYKHKDGVLAYRISQHALARLEVLEQLVVDARAEILQNLNAGIREETGELAINREVSIAAAVANRVVVARTRAGKLPREFVLSSREMRLLRDSSDPSQRNRVIAKLIRRTAVVLRRECGLISRTHKWTDLPTLLLRETLHARLSLKLRFLITADSLGFDTRQAIVVTAGQLATSFRLKRQPA